MKHLIIGLLLVSSYWHRITCAENSSQPMIIRSSINRFDALLALNNNNNINSNNNNNNINTNINTNINDNISNNNNNNNNLLLTSIYNNSDNIFSTSLSTPLSSFIQPLPPKNDSLVNNISAVTNPEPKLITDPKTETIVTTIITENTSAADQSIEYDYKQSRNNLISISIDILQTNMFDSEIELCKHVINGTVSHEYGSRKTARLLKTELDQIFKDQKYRFSVVISSDAQNIISKRLYGIWISLVANRKHYFLIGSYKAVKTAKLTEAQLDRIEDWTSVYFITYENMTRSTQVEKVAKMVKDKLDLNYGKGNAWAVIGYQQSYAIKGKKLLDETPNLQFKRLDGSLWFVFRGGEDIPQTNREIKPKYNFK